MKFGIAARLGVALTLVSIVSGGITGYITYLESRERLVDEAQQRLIATATVAARRLSVTLEYAGREVLLLSSDPETHAMLKGDAKHQSASSAYLREHLASDFKRLLSLNPHFAELRLIARNEFGIERVRVVRTQAQQLQQVAEDDLRETGHLAYVRQGLSIPSGTFYMSPLTLRRPGGAQSGLGEPTLIITSTVADEHGEILGLVVLNLHLASLFDDIVHDLPPLHSLYLTNRLGDYLLHPDPQKAFAFERGRQARVQDDFPQTAHLLDQYHDHAPVLVEPGEGREALLAAFISQDVPGSVAGSGFIFGLSQPADELMSSSSALTSRVIQVMLMFSIVAFLLAVLIARAMTKPLRNMAYAVQHFSSNGEMLPLPVQRSDEIGQLAQAASAAQHRIAETLSALEAKRSELSHLARHDPLTGVANRLLFSERAELALARANRTGQSLAVLLIDLDDFKPVNDEYGHAAGDAVLVAIAGRIRATVRETDTVARMGGDEFVVLLEGIETHDHIESVVRKLIAVIRQPVTWAQFSLQVHASIGINIYPDTASGFDPLMSGADHAMYQAKNNSGGYAYFTPTDLEARQHTAIGDDR